MAMYKVTVKQEITAYEEADDKEFAEAIVKRRIGTGSLNLSDGEIVVTAEETNDVPPEEVERIKVSNSVWPADKTDPEFFWSEDKIKEMDDQDIADGSSITTSNLLRTLGDLKY